MLWKWLKNSFPMGANQEEFETIHCRHGVRNFSTPAGEEYAAPFVESAIQLEPEDIAVLLNGGILVITQLGRGWNPLSLSVHPSSELVDDGSNQ